MVIINQTIINNLAAKINAKEKQSNKTTTISSSSTDTQYPSAKAVYTALQNANDDLFFKTKNGSTSNYINLFEIRPTGDYQAKPITFEIVRNTKPTPIYVSVRLTNVTLASNDYSVQVFYAWGTSDTTVYIRKEANNVFNVIVLHTANEEMSICNMNNPNQSVKITPLGTVYGTDAPASSGDNQVWYHTYTVGGTTFGTGTNNVVRGNDSRLSDTRNPKSTKISAGSDLNTYTTTGFYYNNANTDCATITPLPQPNKAFFLQVEDWGTSNYTKQTITHYDPVKTYERIRNAGTWTDWYELQHNDGTGGENLLRTEPNNEGNSGIAYTIADETFHNDKVYYRNETSQDTTKYSGWTWPIPKNEFDYGDIFTLSFYAKGTNGAEIRTYFAGASGYISNRRISSNSDIDNNVSSYGDGATRFHLTSDWKRYYVTYKLNSTATTPTQNKSIHIRTFGASTDIEFYISNVKLERGYYATDYDRHTRDNEPLYFPTEVSLPTTTTSANRRKFIHPPYKFKNIPNWTVEGEIKVTGNSARFELHKTDDTNLKNFIALGKNAGGNLAYWWGTSSSAESSKVYDASHIAVDTWYPFRISKMGNNVLFMFNNTDKYEVTTTYFNTFEYIEPSIFGYGTSGVSVRNLKITPLEPVHPLSPSSSVCTNAQGIITTESKNNHTHSDTQLNWNGGAMVNSASPLDMCLNEELSPNRLAYLDGNNIDVDYSTDGGSTWTSYGASATEKSKLVTTTQTFISGKGATASSNNQLRITIHSGLTSGSISQIYLATRKLMIYYSTGGGSGNKVKIQTNTYGSPDTWTDVKEYNIGGYSGWNSFPLNITFGGFANQTNTTRIKSIRLIFTITSNHNFNVQKIRLYGENCYVAQSDYAKTGHIYTVDILKNVTFPAKIIKEGGTSSQYLMANGDVQNKITSWSNTPSDSNVASEKLVKDSLDLKSDNTHTHTINLNSSNVYDADNWTTINGNAPTITSNSVQANAVSHHILNKEFVESKYYTLTFEFNTASNRSGLYLFGYENCNKMFGIVTDIGNTFLEQYDDNGNATEIYAGTKNHFTNGWHDIKVIRKGATATLYIDNELYYTFNNIDNCTNLFGLFKWSSGSTTIKNVDVSVDVTELPIDDYVDKNELKNYVEKNNLKTIEGMNLVGSEDIAIDVSYSSSNILFEDACSSASGLSNYESSVRVRGSSSTMTMEYDSTENAYKVYGSGNYHCYMPITALNGKTQYKLSADVKGQAIKYNMIGFFIDNCADTTSYGLGIGLDIGKENGVNQSLWGKLYKVSIDGTGYIVDLTNNPLSTDKYYNLRLEVDGNSYTWSLYDGTTKIAENNVTYTIDNKKVGIFLYCETGTTNSACYIKNIKAKTLDNVIFKDKGVTGDYNSDYTDVQSGITTTVGATGTTLQASGSGDKYRRANALVSGDFEMKYTCTSATTIYGSIAFLSSSNSKLFYVEQETTNYVYINTTGYPIGEAISFPFTMTIKRVGTKLTVWYNDIQVATDITVSDSDGYWAWKLYGNDGRQHTFKDFSIIEYNAGGSENTIYLGDDIMTMINTALDHMITNWENYE